MSLESFMADRETLAGRAQDMARRDEAARSWMATGTPEAVRLLRFDGWMRLELTARIDWAWAGAMKAKRIEQCRSELERLVLELWRRGWMLDGKRLAAHIKDALDDVAAAQRAGRVKDFWPFFQSVVARYVGINAEEIRAEAMQVGAHAGQVFERLNRGGQTDRAMPELLAQRRDETIRERLQRERAAQQRAKIDAAQQQLF